MNTLYMSSSFPKCVKPHFGNANFKDCVLVNCFSHVYPHIYANIYEELFSKTWSPNLELAL